MGGLHLTSPVTTSKLSTQCFEGTQRLFARKPLVESLELFYRNENGGEAQSLGYGNGRHRRIHHAHAGSWQKRDHVLFHIPLLGTKLSVPQLIAARDSGRGVTHRCWPHSCIPEKDPRVEGVRNSKTDSKQCLKSTSA